MELASTVSAICSGWAATGAMGGEIPVYYGRAPQGASGMYATISLVVSTPEYSWTDGHEAITLQINLFDDSEAPDDVVSAAESLHAWLDQSTTLTGLTGLVDIRRQSHMLLEDPIQNSKSPAKSGGWHSATRYRILVRHSETEAEQGQATYGQAVYGGTTYGG